MSHLLTQPEEVEQIFMEVLWNEDMDVATPIPAGMQSNTSPLKSWQGCYVPPYRALHMMNAVRDLSFKL